MSKSRIIATAGIALAAVSALSVTACGSTPPDYMSATTCVASIVTGPNTSYLDGNSLPGFTTYVVVNDSLSQSPADCDADIAYEGEAAPPRGDIVTILTALPKGLTPLPLTFRSRRASYTPVAAASACATGSAVRLSARSARALSLRRRSRVSR